jgi:hypothetical protein
MHPINHDAALAHLINSPVLQNSSLTLAGFRPGFQFNKINLGELPDIIMRQKVAKAFTFKVKSFVPSRVEGPSFDLGLEAMFFVRQQGDTYVRVRGPGQIFGWQLFSLEKQPVLD